MPSRRWPGRGLADGGENWLPAVPAAWVAAHLDGLPPDDRSTGSVAVADLWRWARTQGLPGVNER